MIVGFLVFQGFVCLFVLNLPVLTKRVCAASLTHRRNTKFGVSGGIHWWVSTISGVGKPFSLPSLSLGLKLDKGEHKQAEQVNLLFLVIRFVFCESYITIVLVTS